MLREVLLSLLGGFGQSLQLFCYTLLGALPLGLVIAFGSMNRWRPLREAVRGLVWVIRGTPLMLQLIVVYYGPGLLNNGSHLWGGGTAGRMSAAAVAFIINYACYFSEIYRGGIESIPRGQREAGQAYIKSHGLIWPLLLTGVFYLLFSGFLSWLLRREEKRLSYFE